jgi:hypothetical protein
MIEILYKVPIRAPVAATFRTRYPGLKPPAGRDRVLAIRGARGRAPPHLRGTEPSALGCRYARGVRDFASIDGEPVLPVRQPVAEHWMALGGKGFCTLRPAISERRVT